MAKKVEFKWEKLDDNTRRCKVINGWLVLHTTSMYGSDGKKKEAALSESMIFVADQHWEWQILPPVENRNAVKMKLVKDFEPKA